MLLDVILAHSDVVWLEDADEKVVHLSTLAGIPLDVFVISFEQDKMTLRVPTTKARSCGMRPLASGEVVDQAMTQSQSPTTFVNGKRSQRAQV